MTDDLTADDIVENREVRKLRRLAHLLDSSIPLAGGYRIGLDGIIGLVPFVGDAAGALLSSYIVIRAAQLGVSTRSLLGMMVNIMVETVIGSTTAKRRLTAAVVTLMFLFVLTLILLLLVAIKLLTMLLSAVATGL